MGRETLTQLTKHSYLITSYFVVKLVYAGNAIVQILLISAFVGPEYRLYGLHVVERLLRHLDWARLEHFPRVTLCEFSIRYQSRVHQYVTQWVHACSPVRRPVRALHQPLQREDLPIPLVLARVRRRRHPRRPARLAVPVALLARAGPVLDRYWIGQVQYVRRRLRAFDAAQRPPAVLAKFTENYLRRDGLFVIRMIGLNVGDVVAGEVLCGLWNNYSPERRMLAERIDKRSSRASGGSAKAHLNGSASASGRPDSMIRIEMV